MIEEDTSRSIVVPAGPNESQASVNTTLKAHVSLNASAIVTDSGSALAQAGKVLPGVPHKTVNHSKRWVEKDGTHTEHVESRNKQFKKNMLRHGHSSTKDQNHLLRGLGEYVFEMWYTNKSGLLRYIMFLYALFMDYGFPRNYFDQYNETGMAKEDTYDLWFEIDSITDDRTHKKVKQYQVKWTGYDKKEWVDYNCVTSLAVQAYKKTSLHAKITAFAQQTESKSLEFPVSLSIYLRKYAHTVCEGLGLKHKSKSQGKKKRKLVIWK